MKTHLQSGTVHTLPSLVSYFMILIFTKFFHCEANGKSVYIIKPFFYFYLGNLCVINVRLKLH